MKRVMQYSYDKGRSGFTLIEVMVVIVILGILASMIVPRIMSRPEQAREIKAKEDMRAIQSALDLYQLDTGLYPTTEQGLQALVRKPTSSPLPSGWKEGGYLKRLPKDPWGEPYQYTNDNDKITIYSYGKKGKAGNSKITNDEDDNNNSQ